MATSDSAAGDSQNYGVTAQGFIVKPFTEILNDAFARARMVMGADVDLRSSSSLRKLLELTSLEDALLWMRLDGVYQDGFVASAGGAALDLLGSDLGLARGRQAATGAAKLKLTAAAPKRCVYTLPPGTLVETADTPPLQFRLQSRVTLVKHDPPDGSEEAGTAVTAVVPGPAGNIAANRLARLDATFAARHLSFDPGFIAVSNGQPFSGGEQWEGDGAYRRRLYGLPRALWTADAVRAAVLAVDGVRDALVYDPYGGLDRAAPPFGEFCFSDATFQLPRELCNPYFFSVTVASNPGVLWEGAGDVQGLREQILTALQPIRPVSVFPTLSPADSVEVALRVTLTLPTGTDAGSVLAAARQGLTEYIGSLRLGDAVLYAQVLRILAETPGIVDVQDLHLRRCPPRYAEVVFGPPATFGDEVDLSRLETPCGGNLTLAPREVAVFAIDSPLMDFEVQRT